MQTKLDLLKQLSHVLLLEILGPVQYAGKI